MFMTLDIWVPLVLGGICFGTYIACVLHFRELCEVQGIYKEMVDRAEQAEALLEHEARRDEHCGWANKETWSLVIMIDNDESLYHHFMQLIRDFAKDFELSAPLNGEDTRRLGHHISYHWGNLMEEWFEMQDDMFLLSKIMIGSDWRVDWFEVGEWASEKLEDYDPYEGNQGCEEAV